MDQIGIFGGRILHMITISGADYLVRVLTKDFPKRACVCACVDPLASAVDGSKEG